MNESKEGTSRSIIFVARGPLSDFSEPTSAPRSTLSSLMSKSRGTASTGRLAKSRSIFTLSKSKVMIGTTADSIDERFSTESWSSRITLSESKKSSRVTWRGATQIVSMSIPFSLMPRRYEPEVYTCPPARSATSAVSPFDRHTERTQSWKIAASAARICCLLSCSSAVSSGDASSMKRSSLSEHATSNAVGSSSEMTDAIA